MHRAVVLMTLVLLLFAVAGVTAAQESGTFAAGPNGKNSPESTMPETTTPGRGSSTLDDAQEAGEDAPEPAVVIDPLVEKPTVVDPAEEGPAAGSSVDEEHGRPDAVDRPNPGKPESSGKGVGKPEHAGKPGHEEHRGEQEDRHGGQQKVTLCHKGKNSLTVGLPAKAAHLHHHGERLEAC
jgi:hypothetical protein